MSTLPQAVRTRAELDGSSVALVDGGIQLTYADLRTQADRAATHLFDLGARPGDRLVIIGHNTVG